MQLQSSKLLRLKVEEMHLQGNTVFELWAKVTNNVAKYLPHHVTYAAAKFEVDTFKVKREMHLQENTVFDLDLRGHGHMKCCPVTSTYVTYAAARFEAATSNGLGEDAFTRKNTI